MRCDKCRNEAVFFQSSSGRNLCARHLVLDVEARAKRSIRSNCWMRRGDHIAVFLTGDRTSAALLHFFRNLTAGRRDIRLSALVAGEKLTGSAGFQDSAAIAESLQIPFTEIHPPCGDGQLTGDAVSRIALAFTLDDIAQGTTGLFLGGDADHLLHPPPEEWIGVPVICPFITIPCEETDRYLEYAGKGIPRPNPLNPHEKVAPDIPILLEDYYRRHPGTRYALMHLAEQLSGGRPAAPFIPRFTGQDAGRNGRCL